MERKLHRIAQKLTNKDVVLCLGLNLDLEKHTIDAKITDNSNSITRVAHEMLQMWYWGQENPENAYYNLGEALIKSKLNMFARQVLDYPPIPLDSEKEDKTSLSDEAKNTSEKVYAVSVASVMESAGDTQEQGSTGSETGSTKETQETGAKAKKKKKKKCNVM